MIKPIQIKDSNVLRALMEKPYHPTLLDIVVWIADTYGVCITEGHREALHSGDVHNTDPCRAMDLRYWFYSPDLARAICDNINCRWEYDSKRPDMRVAIIHNSGKGIHFHIQVHTNTKRR